MTITSAGSTRPAARLPLCDGQDPFAPSIFTARVGNAVAAGVFSAKGDIGGVAAAISGRMVSATARSAPRTRSVRR